MKLEIKYVKDPGNIENERVVLVVVQPTDIGRYIIADSTYLSNGNVSNLLRHVFWLPDQLVTVGDFIVVYTKDGNNSSKINKEGTRSFFFYWGLDKTIWNKDGDTAVIFEINDWNMKKLVGSRHI